MTLEERIAEVVATWEVADTAKAIARAVVAVLPTADVSNAEIEAALSVDLSAFPDFGAINRALVANVRALLDAQAAAHAAEVERLHNVYDAALFTAHTAGVAEVEALRAEVERLTESLDYANQGKAELEAEVVDQRGATAPRVTGRAALMEENLRRAAIASTTGKNAEADRDAYRARIDAVRALIEEPFTAADIRAALDGA